MFLILNYLITFAVAAEKPGRDLAMRYLDLLTSQTACVDDASCLRLKCYKLDEVHGYV